VVGGDIQNVGETKAARGAGQSIWGSDEGGNDAWGGEQEDEHGAVRMMFWFCIPVGHRSSEQLSSSRTSHKSHA